MVLFRFLFAPVLLAVATFVGAGHGGAQRARSAATDAPRAVAPATLPAHVQVHVPPAGQPRADAR
jgi:hypothetical protein